MSLFDGLKNVWSAFKGRDPTPQLYSYYGGSIRQDRKRISRNNLKSTISSIYNRISVDCAGIRLNHVRLDENERYREVINDNLNKALCKSANLDQTGRELVQDIVMSMLDEGYVAVVPVTTSQNPNFTDSYDIYELRTGKIVDWYPEYVRVELYDERTGDKKNILVAKKYTAIIENPFYATMNEPNSTAQRLLRVLNQLDHLNDEHSSGKLDLIIQLPYVIKTEARKKQAEERRKAIEAQLTGSTYGIAYTDGTERIVQLNRSLENNLWEQAKDLREQLYNQLGLTKSIFDGTADEKTLLNYNNQTIEPIMSAIAEEMERKWISRTAQTQGQAIRFFKDPFKLVPVAQLAEIADKFTRNEITTSNEMRSVIGMKPIDDPRADELRNANLNHPDEEGTTNTVIDEVVKKDEN